MPEVADRRLVRLAHVEQVHVVTAIEPRLQFFDRDVHVLSPARGST